MDFDALAQTMPGINEQNAKRQRAARDIMLQREVGQLPTQVAEQQASQQLAQGMAQQQCEALLQQQHCELEYIALADADTLKPLADFDLQKDMIVLIAARVGGVRLIDNLLI